MLLPGEFNYGSKYSEFMSVKNNLPGFPVRIVLAEVFLIVGDY